MGRTTPGDTCRGAPDRSARGGTTSSRSDFELVWTGPDSNVIPVRQTGQVLLDLIGSAKRSLLVVSYAVFRIPKIREALVEAAQRGVQIRMVLDLATASDIQGYNPLLAVGDDVIAGSEILYWPEERRVADADGRRGSLHVKCFSRRW